MKTEKQCTDKRHSSCCTCRVCTEKTIGEMPDYQHWKERRRQRLHPAPPKQNELTITRHTENCTCKGCQTSRDKEFNSDSEAHDNWRRRRQLRHRWPSHNLEMEADRLDSKIIEKESTDNTKSWREFARVVLSEIRQAAKELHQLRIDLKLPVHGQPGFDKFTLAKFKAGGKTYFGINAHGQKVFVRVNAISKTHAEGDIFNQVMKDGLKPEFGTLIVDRPMCRACGVNGAVTSLARQAGLKKIRIIEPGAITSLTL